MKGLLTDKLGTQVTDWEYKEKLMYCGGRLKSGNEASQLLVTKSDLQVTSTKDTGT